MSVSLLTPDMRRLLAGIERRLGILERRVSTTAGGTTDDSTTLMFSFAGALTASTSPPARVWRGGNLTVLAVTLGTAGSTDTVIEVQRNGTAVGTVTVPSGSGAYNGEVSARYGADGDILTLEITTAGTGSADMTAEARFA